MGGWWSGWRVRSEVNTCVGLHILWSLFMRLLLELNPSNKCIFQETYKHYTQKSGKVRVKEGGCYWGLEWLASSMAAEGRQGRRVSMMSGQQNWCLHLH